MQKSALWLSRCVFALIVLLLISETAPAQAQMTNDPEFYGPYNATFLVGGIGLTKPLVEKDTVLRAASPWSLYCWVRIDEAVTKPTLVAGIGKLEDDYPRYLGMNAGKFFLWMGKDNSLSAPAALVPSKWHLLAATFDGSEFKIYSDGTMTGTGKLALGDVAPVFQMAPVDLSSTDWEHFGGAIAMATILRRALTADEIQNIYQQPENFSLLMFEEGSKPWPVQTRAQAGYPAPQDPATMPRSKAAFSHPVVHAVTGGVPALQADGPRAWMLAGGWIQTEAPKVEAGGEQISGNEFDAKEWIPATVPGTVLTSMIDQGIYPDPDYGLNNLAIPESLNKQDYWYRNEFKAPEAGGGRQWKLVFHGINYKATVWLNGTNLGTITGAFIRGIFDVTNILRPGQSNVLAVKVSPPPHPGIPNEQSVKGGPGENGGALCLDGPTFVDTEGWDWIPAIRDRNTGIWQPVTLIATGVVAIGDPQVITTLPLPDTSRADIRISVPLENASSTSIQGTLKASFEQITVEKSVTLSPGKNVVELTPSEFAELVVQHPRLWWPNGYGKPELYSLKLAFSNGEGESDTKQMRFGIREITYELSLLDSQGHLRRVEFDPTLAKIKNEQVINVFHEGMRQIPSSDPVLLDPVEGRWHPHYSWVASLFPGAETSSSVHMVEDTKVAPYLIIKVNGVRIACRGGSWGMDDSRKRVSRSRLEPFFRLHRDANINIIRNWVGQDTEEVFYDLADEYGLMVWNDFWESTQDDNVEAEDPALFLANARDVILRFRNHPSIVMWCGRNEGVPQPVINNGLVELTRSLDGTRYYSPSSNQVNLQTSGPYLYKNPILYYTLLNRGFSVETGTQSMPTLETIRAWIPKEDQWPINDDWAYHDWHQSGNGDTASFMAEMQAEFGAPTSLEDFERKAQMLNYVSHRAIFEGMNAHLWAPNSGRMLWMTQPAWPSTMWQILSSDYDTHASFYAVKKACEPVHVQLDLSDYTVSIVNTTREPLSGLLVTASVYSLDNKLLLHREEHSSSEANSVTNPFKLDLAPLLSSDLVIVKLALQSANGMPVSENLYWLGNTSWSYHRLNTLPPAKLSAKANAELIEGNVRVKVELQNQGSTVALAIKMTLLHRADGSRILPAYLSDNYISLLPGERREIEIEYPSASKDRQAQIAFRGWNVTPLSIDVGNIKP